MPDHEQSSDEHQHHQRKMYLRFGAMIATSTAVMFLLMYHNVYAASHIRWSEERFYMALLMGGTMGVIMLGYMWHMYADRRINLAIVGGSLALVAVALFLSRSQLFVDDREYMKGMIPHHSIAILTSENSDIDDIRVCELANEIIRAQRVEIDEMEWLIDDIAENGEVTTEAEAERRPVPEFDTQETGRDC